MKANQAFRNADEAVSPVIGVILMVAITVVLAAVVFVLVSNLSKTSDKSEEVGITAASTQTGEITVQMIRAGANAPYTWAAGPNSVSITMDGLPCPAPSASAATVAVPSNSGGATNFAAGNVVTFKGDCASTPVALVSNTQHPLTVTIRGTVVFQGSVTVR